MNIEDNTGTVVQRCFIHGSHIHDSNTKYTVIRVSRGDGWKYVHKWKHGYEIYGKQNNTHIKREENGKQNEENKKRLYMGFGK